MEQLTNPYETPFDGNESTRAARESIDSDIHRLEERIFMLRRERNRLSSTAILPPEVLSKIFVFTRDATDPYHHSQLQWIRAVTHICHHWREVALDCPTLWSIPVFARPAVAKEMMNRSKMAALAIRSTTGSWTPKMMEQLENAMTQISRIKILHLSFAVHPDKLRNIFAPLSQPALLLEKISLSDTSYQPYNNQKGLPDNAFINVPLLRSINLDRINFSWQAAIFKHQTVTVLQLRNVRAFSDETSTFGQMMEALNNMPNLQILHLKSVIPSHNTASSNESVLQLNSLESLSIEANISECAQLLRCIQYPPRTKINIFSSSNSFEEWSPLMLVIGQAMRGAQDIQDRVAQAPYHIREATVRQDHSTATIKLYDELSDRQSLTSVGEIFSPESVVTLQLQGPGDYGAFPVPDCLLKDVFDSFDFPTLELLHLVLRPGHRQPSVLRECIGCLPKLKHLRVQGCAVPVFNAVRENLEGRETPLAIEPPAASSRACSSSRRRISQYIFPPVTIFPSLKTLHIDEAELRESRVPGSMDNLVDMLRQRSDMNAPIDRLRLDNCRGVWSSRQRKRLAEVVVNLEIDGEDIDITSLDDVDDFTDDDESDYGEEDFDDEDYGSDDLYEGAFDYDFEDAFGLIPFYH